MATQSLTCFGEQTQMGRLDPFRPAILGELRSLLQAMMDLPVSYGYIWFEYTELKIGGPGNQLWDLVQRLAELCVSGAGSTKGISVAEFDNFIQGKITDAKAERSEAFKEKTAWGKKNTIVPKKGGPKGRSR